MSDDRVTFDDVLACAGLVIFLLVALWGYGLCP